MSFDDFLRSRGRNSGVKAAAKIVLNAICEDAFGVGNHSIMLQAKDEPYSEDDLKEAFDRLHKAFFDINDGYNKKKR
jgi:hypothetical protein